ncbi:transcription repressor OFP5-like [Phoenix dactylifera]|uniref:Transcription repressor n=1 Tax=Phoenix dactylifera TaxID=42345 RepID=A0A8B7C243_PHODC|nr:transcription repressor OFP5-like [Phoenix dactylifera]
MQWTRRREQQEQTKRKKKKKKKHLSSTSRSSTSFSFTRVLPPSLISKLKRLATKLNSRPHKPKRSTAPKPISHSSPASSSSSTAGVTPSPYHHRSAAHRLPSSPVDDVLRRIAARFPPSVDDERLLVRSRTSRPTRPSSLTDLELRPIRCRRSDFRLAGSSPETPRALEIPTEIERSGADRRLRRRNQRWWKPIDGSETPRRRPLGDRRLKGPATEETEGSPDPTTRSTPPRLPKPIENAGIDPPRRLMHGPDPDRKSIAGKIRRRARVRVYSPRAEMGRTKASAARVRGKDAEKGRRELESFAVLKCSRDPQRDFRESMMEMIAEKGMRQAEELEGLLACYLYVNSDQHHDVIVKVFRQVWLDLIRERFGSESESESELGDSCSPAFHSRAG